MCAYEGFPEGSVAKNLPANGGDTHVGSIPESGRSPERENENLFQYSCLRIPCTEGPIGATVHGVTKSQTRLRN